MLQTRSCPAICTVDACLGKWLIIISVGRIGIGLQNQGQVSPGTALAPAIIGLLPWLVGA